MIAATALRPPPPHPRERDKSINNLLIYFTSLSSNLIAGSFVSVELWWGGGGVGGVEGEINEGRVEGCRRVEEGKKFLCSCCLFRPCVAAFFFCRRRFSRHSLCVSTASAVCLPLQHCLHWFITLQKANTRTHTREHTSEGRKTGESNPSTNYQQEKI